MTDSTVSVDRLMREIEGEVRRDRRARLVARGGPDEYADQETFAIVERVLRRAVEDRNPDLLLLQELLGDEERWQPQLHLRFSSHHPLIGAPLLFVKRRLLLPVLRWLYEYSLENFRRQQRLNRVLLACIEDLAIENARLRREFDSLIGRGR